VHLVETAKPALAARTSGSQLGRRARTVRQRLLTAGALAAVLGLTLPSAAVAADGRVRWPTGRTTAALAPAALAPAAADASAAAVPADLTDYVQADRTDTQWSLAATHTPAAWPASTGSGVVVATIDTGVDPTTPDLAGQLLPGAHLDPNTDTIVAGSTPDQVGHGTHVAGIIAATGDGHGITGVAPGAKIMPINVGTGDNGLTGTDIASALRWATTHGARVVNLSLGFADVAGGAQDVSAICRAVAAAVAAKVVVVASAGNDGQGTNSPEAPARCAGAISVAAVDSTLHATSWSSFDATVTIAAPGDSIYSTVPAEVSPLRYADESGTSMSSPFVAGVAALVLAQHPDWTPAQVTARLVDTAQDVPPPGPDPRTGAGVVDPPAAVGVDAPPPVAVPTLVASAEPYASHSDSSGRLVYDQVVVHWVPDPTVAVSGYRITRWTSAGETTSAVSADSVRVLFPAGPAGYTVTALTADGEVPAAPMWFPLPGQDMTPVSPVTGLHASWGRSGSVTLAWSNPRTNRGLADEWAVVLNGGLALSQEQVTVPGHAVLSATRIPGGDLVISVLVGSSSSNDSEETEVALPARVPFSGTAVPAGRGRYRVFLVLAAGRRLLCGRTLCTGLPVIVSAGGYLSETRVDGRGQVVALVTAAQRRGRLTVSVDVPGHPRLSDRAVTVAVV
jgi:subtilisin family serine protease